MYIGKLVHNLPDISFEYHKLACEDEEVAHLLYINEKYRHSAYFFLQAMEKYVRARIFNLVNPDVEYFRNRARTHNLDELLDFLIELVSSKGITQDQVKAQIEQYVLGGVKFGMLHNNLRYPFYIEKSHTYSILQIDREAAELMCEKLKSLKAFLQDIDMLRR
jgi:HEPN domain-containing protein